MVDNVQGNVLGHRLHGGDRSRPEHHLATGLEPEQVGAAGKPGVPGPHGAEGQGAAGLRGHAFLEGGAAIVIGHARSRHSRTLRLHGH